MPLILGVVFLFYQLPLGFVKFWKKGIRFKGSMYPGQFNLVGVFQSQFVYFTPTCTIRQSSCFTV